MRVKDITSTLEQWAPLSYQEDYDNSGLLVGDPSQEVRQVLITLDVTEAVIQEAIESECQLIVAHHPLIFRGLKRVNTGHWVERCVRLAIKHDISIYAIHTNLDNVHTGVNAHIARRLGLEHTQVLAPKSGMLQKLTTFCPISDFQAVLNALYQAGAGQIGEYDHCSFQVKGTGTFRPSAEANPTIGAAGQDETVEEMRLEVLVPAHLQQPILQALRQAHPYEEVAYYLSPLANVHQEVGSGMIGELQEALTPHDFIKHLKSAMQVQVCRHTAFLSDRVRKVAVCGGAGSFLLQDAIRAGADVLVTADFKYHDFFEADGKIVVADIGHYESEVFTKDLLKDFLKQKFANIAFRLSGVVTNPIIYS